MGGETDRPRGVDVGRLPIDARIDTPSREGLTGTTPASMYQALQDTEQVTIAPDWRPMEEQPAWRTEFPVDLPEDQYVERREFMKFLVLTSLALTAGQFWIGLRHWWQGLSGGPPPQKVASLSDIPVGGVLTFDYPEASDACVLIRTGETAFVAYGQKCTHLSCPVQPDVERGVIHCPCHNGWFDLQSGRPLAGPPRRPLPLVKIELRGGDIFVSGVDERTV